MVRKPIYKAFPCTVSCLSKVRKLNAKTMKLAYKTFPREQALATFDWMKAATVFYLSAYTLVQVR